MYECRKLKWLCKFTQIMAILGFELRHPTLRVMILNVVSLHMQELIIFKYGQRKLCQI